MRPEAWRVTLATAGGVTLAAGVGAAVVVTGALLGASADTDELVATADGTVVVVLDGLSGVFVVVAAAVPLRARPACSRAARFAVSSVSRRRVCVRVRVASLPCAAPLSVFGCPAVVGCVPLLFD